jgi:hypothetical protein
MLWRPQVGNIYTVICSTLQKLGFESKVENMKSEIFKNERDRHSYAIATTFLNSAIIQQHNYIIQQYQNIKQIAVLGEFGPLIRADKGENVLVNELKFALIMAIEILVRELRTNHSTTKVLNSAKMALKNTLNDII